MIKPQAQLRMAPAPGGAGGHSGVPPVIGCGDQPEQHERFPAVTHEEAFDRVAREIYEATASPVARAPGALTPFSQNEFDRAVFGYIAPSGRIIKAVRAFRNFALKCLPRQLAKYIVSKHAEQRHKRHPGMSFEIKPYLSGKRAVGIDREPLPCVVGEGDVDKVASAEIIAVERYFATLKIDPVVNRHRVNSIVSMSQADRYASGRQA